MASPVRRWRPGPWLPPTSSMTTTQQDQDEGDDPEHLHPAWWAGVGPGSGSRLLGVGGVGQPWACPLSHGALDIVREFTRHYVSVNSECRSSSSRILGPVPKLWNETIEAHRRAVRDAILDTTAALVAEHGLRVGDDVADRRADRHRTRDAVQVLPRRRSDPARLARTSDHRPPRTSRRSPRPGRRRLASGSKPCSRPTPSSPMSTTAPNSRRSCIAASTSPARSSSSRDLIRDLLAEGAASRRRPGRCRARRARELLPPRPHSSQQPALQGRGPPARQRHPGRVGPLVARGSHERQSPRGIESVHPRPLLARRRFLVPHRERPAKGTAAWEPNVRARRSVGICGRESPWQLRAGHSSPAPPRCWWSRMTLPTARLAAGRCASRPASTGTFLGHPVWGRPL